MRLLSRSAAVLAIAVLSFLLPPAAARAAVTAAHGDTYVTAATPGQNFATAPTLNVNPQSITLLKFDLTALPTGTTPTQIAKATLLLWVNPSSPNPNGSLAVVPVAKDWNGPAVTYANRPTTLASPKTTQALRPGASSYYLEVDVTEQVKKWITSPATNFGLAVTAATPAVDVALDSKENILSPSLRLDLLSVDERIGEAIDLRTERNTGHTNHSFFIPIEGEAEWLDEVNRQGSAIDDYPLAFFDAPRSRINIRLMISPSGEAGALKSALDYRSKLVERYVDTVREKIVAFNVDLAEKMAIELNKRKEALLKAERELAETGLPRTYNPEHQEMLINMRNLLESLGRHMTNTADHGRKPREVRCFIVHGHDHQSLYELKDYIQNTLELGAPTILRNMPGLGKTLIEQFEVDAPAQRPSRVALGS